MKRVKYACYTVNIGMAIVGNLPPLLFLTFRQMYEISYTFLGLLVLINFFTQLIIDLIFSFFSHRFDIPKAVKFTPVLTLVGLFIYALSPVVFQEKIYWGLVLGTVIFSASSGFAEVLISPVIAALPSPDPDREMSKLHSVYAWGVVGVVLLSSLFILLFTAEKWQWLIGFFMIFPLISVILFSQAEIPEMKTPEKISGVLELLKNKGLWLVVFAIFLGGASECTMAQWASGYLENALNIPKIWGDIFGVALFAVMLGFGRSLYAKIGKNIEFVLFIGAIGATVCYFITALTPFPILGIFTCAFTGFCVSMLWPGSLIIASEKFPTSGVFIYAMMAAGGDLGASIGPQLVGAITDVAITLEPVIKLSENIGISSEQIGMKLGMLTGMLFPVMAIPTYWHIMKKKKVKI